MTIFDQRGQHVTYQYNAAGDINFGTVQNKMEAIGQLENLQAELKRAIDAGVFDDEVATDAEYQLKKAVQQAQKPEPDKNGILGHLTEVKTLIKGVAATGGLTSGLVKAAELVQKFF